MEFHLSIPFRGVSRYPTPEELLLINDKTLKEIFLKGCKIFQKNIKAVEAET